MKKALLTMALVAVSAVAANAQVLRNAEVGARQNINGITKQAVRFTPQTIAGNVHSTSYASVEEMVASRKAPRRVEGVDDIIYDMPQGALYEGPFFDEGEGPYYSIRLDMYTPARQDFTWYNYSSYDETVYPDATFSWLLSDNEMEQDEYGNGIGSMWGGAYMPQLSLVSNAGETIDSYIYSQDNNGTALNGIWFSSTDDIINLTNARCAGGVYTGWSSYGSFTVNEPFADTEQTAVGFAQYFNGMLGHVWAEGINIWLLDSSGATTHLGDATITATVSTFDFDEAGNMVLVPIATATATEEDCVGGNDSFLLNFYFTDEDPIMGEVESPIILPQEDFIVTFTGFEDVPHSLTAAMNPAYGFQGFGYAIVEDGSFKTISYSNSNTPMQSLIVSFSGVLPDMELADPDLIVDFPIEGGYGITYEDVDENGDLVQYEDIDFFSNFNYEEWSVVDAPDWVTEVEYDDSYLERGYLVWYLMASELPEDVEGRWGKVVFELYGKQVEVYVKQGEVDLDELAVKSVNADNNSSKSNALYSLSGQKLQKAAKGLVITNGKKFINK